MAKFNGKPKAPKPKKPKKSGGKRKLTAAQQGSIDFSSARPKNWTPF